MNVGDSMTRAIRTCRPEESLAAAARILWEQDCGIVPVLDGEGDLVGVVTDRDACMAAYTRGQRLDEIPVHTAMARVVSTCGADWPLERALAVMRQQQVRRLPVLDERNRCCGVLSLSDVVRVAGEDPALRGAVVGTLAAVSRPRSEIQSGATVVLPAAPRGSAPPAGAPTAATSGGAAATDRPRKPKSRKK
jgi:CBS-domain-containing membrane protein